MLGPSLLVQNPRSSNQGFHVGPNLAHLLLKFHKRTRHLHQANVGCQSAFVTHFVLVGLQKFHIHNESFQCSRQPVVQ